jgi:hypothetical protein
MKKQKVLKKCEICGLVFKGKVICTPQANCLNITLAAEQKLKNNGNKTRPSV